SLKHLKGLVYENGDVGLHPLKIRVEKYSDGDDAVDFDAVRRIGDAHRAGKVRSRNPQLGRGRSGLPVRPKGLHHHLVRPRRILLSVQLEADNASVLRYVQLPAVFELSIDVQLYGFDDTAAEAY